jgi:excisionase family DNA binding protein
MESRPTQFGVRENTASSRRHEPRFVMSDTQPESSERPTTPQVFRPSTEQAPARTASGATVEEKLGNVQTGFVRPQVQVAEHYVGAAEAAKFLSITRRTLLQMARDGVVPAHPLGNGPRRLWRFLLAELDWWMRDHIQSNCRPCSPNRRKS